MKPPIASSNQLVLKQSAISEEALRDTTSSGLTFFICAVLFVGSGIPAWCVAHLWTVLDISTLLGLSVSGQSVFRLLYLAGLGCCVPLLLMLTGFNVISAHLDFLAATLEITERGICWRANNLLTLLILRVARQPVQPVSWDRIRVVSFGESGHQLKTEFKTEFEGMTLDSPYSAVGSYRNLNFIAAESNKFRSLIAVSVSSLSDQSRKNLALMINNHAAKAVMTKSAVEELLGTAVEKSKDLSYTDIWLNVLHSNDEQKRITDLTPGDCLNDNRLKIIRKLATGGQANLFLAEREDGEMIVLKEYIVSTISSTSAMLGLEEFESERSILEKIAHQNAAKSFGVFAEQGRAYIMMEYHNGRSLREIVDASGAIEFSTVSSIAKQLADVLGTLHEMEPPVIHRDVSPDNVILMDDGCVKLIDFSVARQGESRESGDFVGKASYVSPEQFRGFVNRKNDVYGYGATLYFAIVGKDPEPISQLHAPDMVTESQDAVFDLAELIFKCTSMDELNPSFSSMAEVARLWQNDNRLSGVNPHE